MLLVMAVMGPMFRYTRRNVRFLPCGRPGPKTRLAG